MTSRLRSAKLREYSKQIDAGIFFLANQGITAIGVCDLIKDKLPAGLANTPSQLSKWKGAYKNKKYQSKYIDTDLLHAKEAIDSIIYEKYRYTYNGKEYVPDNENIRRFESLIGTYIGYSWNAKKSRLSNGIQENYLHKFKVEVISKDLIKCVTNLGTFTSSQMKLAGNNIAMELFNEKRRIYLIVQIGNIAVDDLARADSFRIAYTDSGTTNVRCGLALLEKIDQEAYQPFIPSNVLFQTVLEEKGESTVGFLRYAQLVIY